MEGDEKKYKKVNGGGDETGSRGKIEERIKDVKEELESWRMETKTGRKGGGNKEKEYGKRRRGEGES